MIRTGSRMPVALLAAASLILAACGGEATGPGQGGSPAASPAQATGEPSGTIRLYTSVTEDTVNAVVDAYRSAHPDVDVEVFRAPTGELTARIAAEQREGRIRADVLWLTDPLSMQQYAAEGVLRRWDPPEAAALAPELVEDTFWGTRLLNVVVVHQARLDPAPVSWQDLADRDYEQPVAIPDPGFAGSAFGVLAFFALDDRFGFDYYRALAAGGAVQVQAPGEVVTGVAEGRFAAGMSLDKVVRDAADKGSPVALVAPAPGAVAIYSPVAVVDASRSVTAAESFANFTLSVAAQQGIAATGWQPVRAEVDWPHDLDQVFPDWQAAFDRRNELLDTYRSIFGG